MFDSYDFDKPIELEETGNEIHGSGGGKVATAADDDDDEIQVDSKGRKKAKHYDYEIEGKISEDEQEEEEEENDAEKLIPLILNQLIKLLKIINNHQVLCLLKKHTMTKMTKVMKLN